MVRTPVVCPGSHRHGRHDNGGGEPGPQAQRMNGGGRVQTRTENCLGMRPVNAGAAQGSALCVRVARQACQRFMNGWNPPGHRPTGEPEDNGSQGSAST